MQRSLVVRSLGICLALGVAACGGGNSTPACPEGTANCACRADATCDTGLTCTDGFCVTAVPCPDGSEGCPCYANGTCDSKDGVVMTCEDAVCVVPGAPVFGDLGDACDEASPCGLHDGTQLECRDATCQLPVVACPVGTFGCPCDGGACQGGLECVADACQAAAGSGVTVANADVRACDLLLDQAAGVDVQFGAAVLGVTAREGARVAVSFSARADAGLTAPVGALVGTDGAVIGAGGVTLATVACYDRHGAAVAEPGVALK